MSALPNPFGQVELNEEQRAGIDKIEKLLRLAGKNPNKEEAESASAKAFELMATLNLDLATVEQNSGDKGKRGDLKMKGGLYQWQRDIWQAVAQLNFCWYWSQQVYDREKTRTAYRTGYMGNRYSIGKRKGGYTFVHRLVGRVVNIKATQVMAEYLQQTIERLARERVGDGSQFFTKWAISYRTGIADEVVQKIYERRRTMLDEIKQKEFEEAERAKQAGMKGASTGTSITLASIVQSEHDANADFLYGEGFSARRREADERAARARREAEEEWTRWAAAHPEEAAKEEARRREEKRKADAKAARRAGAGRSWNGDYSAYTAGREKGKSVSIDMQTGTTKPAGALG